MALSKAQVALRKKWVTALRSGKYKQGAGRLRQDDRYCCLGVALDVMGCEWVDTEYGYTTAEGLMTGLYPEALDRFGLSDGDQSSLIDMNDVRSADFLEIADTIDLLTLADTDA